MSDRNLVLAFIILLGACGFIWIADIVFRWWGCNRIRLVVKADNEVFGWSTTAKVY